MLKLALFGFVLLISSLLRFCYSSFAWVVTRKYPCCEGFSSSEMQSLFLKVGNYGTSALSQSGRTVSRSDDKCSCRLIHTFTLKVLTNLEPRETKIPASVCVFKGITHEWVMNAALLMTLPTPQLLNLPARQNELQTSPRCQEHLISTPWGWWSLTGFQTWPPPSSWGAYAERPRKKSVPCPMRGVTHPHPFHGLTSCVMKSPNPQ